MSSTELTGPAIETMLAHERADLDVVETSKRDAIRARLFAALEPSGNTTRHTSGREDATAGRGGADHTRHVPKSWVVRAGAIGATIGAALGVALGVAVGDQIAPPRMVVPAPPRPQLENATAKPAPAPSGSESPAPSVVVTASAAAAAGRPVSAAPRGGSEHESNSGRERALLDRAINALARGDHEAALTAIAEHEQRFARGALVEERELLAVRTLVRAARKDEARERAERFRREHPTSIFRSNVDALVAD